MPRYVVYVEYTSLAFTGVRAEGFAARESLLQKVWAEVGGRLESIEWLLSPDWHLMQIGEVPTSDVFFELLGNGKASGVIARTDFSELRTSAQADSVIAPHPSYRAPGS